MVIWLFILVQMNNKQKLIRITTVPISLDKLLEGQLAFMKSTYEVLAVSSGGEILEQVAIKEDIRVIPVEMSRKITPFKDLKTVWKLYLLFKKEQPFIVHTHTPKAGIVGMLAARLAGVKNRLHTVAGMPLLETVGIKRKVLNFVERLTYACATKVYPNSFGLKEIILKNRFVKPSKVKVIGNGSSNGINTTYFNPDIFSNNQKANLRQELKIKESDFVFIFVGRLVGDKGVNELVSAFIKLNQFFSREGLEVCKNPKTQPSKENKNKEYLYNHKTERPHDCTTVRLLLVGPLETNLDPLHPSTLHEIKNNKNIISVGWQQDVRPYFTISNCLVFPSYREGFPNVVMQAGAMGLPSIVTNINGCNEIIEDNKNGWIIPVKNEEAILKAMRNCLTNKEQFNTIKENARQLIVDRFEQKKVWEAILSAYKALEK